MDDVGARTSGRPPARGDGPAEPDRPPRPGPEPARRVPPPTRPADPVPPRSSRPIEALLDSATRPLHGWCPSPGDLPTRRLPRAVPPADEPPTALITAVPDTGAATPTPHPPAPPVPIDGDPDPPPVAAARAQLEPDLHRTSRPAQRRTLRRALLAAAASTLVPGTGHFLLGRRRIGALLLGTFGFVAAALAVLATTLPRPQLLEHLLSTRVLIVAVIACLGGAAAWMGVIVRTYLVGRPRRLRPGQRMLGAATVAALCLVVAAPLGLAAHLADSQRSLLDTLFPSGGAAAAAAIGKPRLNILLVGSDAGPDRTGTRTDTMMVASIDTRSGRTLLFGLPRNIGFARFPPGSRMAEEFPDGFHDDADPLSGDYLLNAVYAYGHASPTVAPAGPTDDPGLNLLQSAISYMLGLPIDYQIVVNMAGFASLIDALGGLRVDVGPERIVIGGIGPHGESIKPKGYIPPGLQQLSGEEALAFARSRTGSTDYVRMGRQRCLLQYVLDQKSPTDLLTNFQAVAKATTDSVSTNIPREVLPALVALAGDSGVALESLAFDPNLPDPDAPDGRFNTFDPNVPYMREVVREAINRPPATTAPAPPADADADADAAPSTSPRATRAAPDGSAATTTKPGTTRRNGTGGSATSGSATTSTAPVATAAPQSLARSC